MKIAHATAAVVALAAGAAASAGFSQESFTGTLSAGGQLDFYMFTITADALVGGTGWVNVQTFQPAGSGDPVDTEIAVYTSGGALVASDDDGNEDGPGFVLYSMLSFGDSDPLFSPADTPAGDDGDLLAGTYTVVVGGFNTNFTPNINDITGGASTGDYTLQISTNVPAPGAAALLATAGLIGLRRRR